MLPYQTLELGEAPFGHAPHDAREIEDLRIGKAVGHKEPMLPALDEGGLFEGFEVLRGIRQRQSHFDRERVDRALALGEELEDLEAVRAREGLAEPRELAVQPVL